MILRLALAGAALAPAAWAQAPAPARGLLDLLPADTLAFVGTDDARGLCASWKDSAAGRLNATTELAPYMEAMGAGLDEVLAAALPALGLKLQTLEEWVDGPCGLALLDLGPPLSGSFEPSMALAFVMGVASHEDEARDMLQRIVEAAPGRGLQASRESDAGTDSITLRPAAGEGNSEPLEVTRLAVHAGTLLVTHEWGAPRSDRLARIRAALDGHGVDVLASRADLAATPAGAAGPDLRGWVDVARLYRAAMDIVAAVAAAVPASADDAQEVFAVFDRLGLDEIQAASARFTLGRELSRSILRLDWPAGSPVRDVLAQLLHGSSRPSLLAVAPESPLFAAGLDADWEEVFDSVVRCFLVGGRLDAAEVTAGLSAMQEELGFDVRDDLLARLDGRVAALMTDAPAGEGLVLPGAGALFASKNMLLALGVSDAAGLRELLEAQLRKAGLHATRQCTDLLGQQVCHLPIFPGVSVDYAILPDLLLLSTSPTLVQDAVRRSATPELPDLAAREDVAAAVAALPAQPGFLGYADSIEWLLMSVRQAHSGTLDAQTADAFGDGLLGRLMRVSQDAMQAYPDLDRVFFERFYKAPALSAATADARSFTWEMRSP